MSAHAAGSAVRSLDELVEEPIRLLAPVSEDFVAAQRMIVESNWQLRAGDALHLAIALAHEAQVFLTLDATLLRIAGRLGISASRGVH
jgi:predicted nucleic acid-binding protein